MNVLSGSESVLAAGHHGAGLRTGLLLLAAATGLPDPTNYGAIGWVVVIVFCLVGGLRQMIGLWRDFQKGPIEKREITLSLTAVERPVFEEHVRDNKREHENLFAKVGGVERGTMAKLDKSFNELRAERALDMNTIHSKTNEIGREVSGLKASNELQNQQLARMDAKIDRILERSTRRNSES